MPSSFPLVRAAGRLCRRAWLGVVLIIVAPLHAADTTKRDYNLPAAAASVSLKLFSEQSGRGLLVSTETAKGVKTNPIKGAFTAGEALALMLAGTGLVAAEDEQNGAFVVKKESMLPKVERAATTNHGDRPARNNELAASAIQESVVEMSPFEVSTAADRGYYGANTMSGTRLNSRIEDLASPITVVTKQQMADFAMLDLNDIFNYEAGTEGTGNYTDFSFDRNFVSHDNTELNPGNANRIRGIGPANITFGSFETSGRTPIDPIDIDAVEISRGPNSSLFGIGNAAGTVNTVRSSANLSKNNSRVTTRVDSFEGYRASLDLNRVLKKDTLAVRGSAVFQHDAFSRKPSGTDAERYNVMFKFRPFKNTSISASYAYYHLYGNRPNTTTPREGITAWREAGSPTWNPVTNTATVNGVPLTGLPASLIKDRGFTTVFLDQTGINHWSFTQTTTTDTPISLNGTRFFASPPRETNTRVQPLLQNFFSPLTDRSIYDWSELNLSAPNWTEDKSAISSVLFDQIIFSSHRQSLAAQLGWFRETSGRNSRNLFGSSSVGVPTVLQIDMNERLLNGVANPNFLRPFFNAALPQHTFSPLARDTYRAQLAYKLDLSRESNGLRWLGHHEVSAYDEYKVFKSRSRSYRPAIVDNHAWIPAGITRGTDNAAGGLAAGPLAMRVQLSSYVGDNQGGNVDYAPAGFQPGVYPLTWGNAATGVFVDEPTQLGTAYSAGGGGSNNWSILKSRGAILQSHFLADRIVTTFGWRHDARFSRAGGPIRLLADGVTLDEASFNSWSTAGWNVGKGPTQTRGVMLKPLSWLSVYANHSDSFQPANVANNLYLQKLADPAGTGDDRGVMLKLFKGTLFVRANFYTTKQTGSRNGDNSTLGTRLLRVDLFPANIPGQAGVAPNTFLLQSMATKWATEAAAAKGQTLTAEQLVTQVSEIMGLPAAYLQPLPFGTSTTADITSKGKEFEISYNPTAFWTLKLNVTEQQTIDTNLAPDVIRWFGERMKVWQSIIDPTTGRPWFTERYEGAQNAADWVAFNVTAPLGLAMTGEGLSRPQIRRYRANFLTNFRLAAITDNRVLKRFNVGGSLRWEDKSAIGYWGVQKLPAIITDYDRSRPIYDPGHYYLDLLAGYRTRLFKDKVGASFQLNVRNVTEDGRLQPIGANPDGTINGYRIISPRVFILSATFDL